MTQPFRTATGGRIDRTRTLRFSFDGRSLEGFAGDTLASALLANGVHLVGRSFKYHRPRGILSAGSEEPNALVTLDRGRGRVTPNLRATRIELYDGLVARSQNRFPSLRFDLGAVAGLAGPLLSAGFYYKTFLWPRALWRHLYEPAIRRAAGLGRAPTEADADRYLHRYAHCDVLVVGAGPAGLAAALAASSSGQRVILCDEAPEPGGSLLAEPGVTIDGWPAADWVREAVTTLDRSILVLRRTTAFGWYPDTLIGLVQSLTDHQQAVDPARPRERLWQVRAGRVILATGAIERPLVFPGNDRPGIMTASAARHFLHGRGVKVGRRVLVATEDDAAYRTAADLHAAGVVVAAVVDRRPDPDSEAVAAVRALGIPIRAATRIVGTQGHLRVHSVRLSGGHDVIACDTVLMSGGFTPSVHLHAQSRQGLAFDAASGCFLPEPNADSVGACAGVFDLAEALRTATAAAGGGARAFAVRGIPAMTPSGAPEGVVTAQGGTAFVDFQNDVTLKDLVVATDEGFVAIEHVKRYTTAGMATDQGKTSSLTALTIVAALTGQPVEAVGQTRFRPPYTPVTFGSLAGAARGALFAPVRRPPVPAAGAVEEDVGTWKRARCFPHENETIAAAVARECLAVRTEAGVFDASTLGKIEIVGPHAGAFLDRIYTGRFSTLAVGRCRYALLLGEDGFIRNDGVIARLAPDRFHVTTTTDGIGFVLHHMEDYLQTEFADLNAWLTPITEQWAVIAVQGPRAAELLAPLIADIDLGAMAHMSVRTGHIGDVAIRLFRVSFTGELGFEVNLPPDHAPRVWTTLIQRGAVPYGTDAMHVLRAEAGFIVIGQETDGSVVPDDVGLGWTIGREKADFVGKRALGLPERVRRDRLQLVGLLPVDRSMVLEEGAQLRDGAPGAGAHALGHVTSSYVSPVLGRGFALALLAAGRARIGAVLVVQAGDVVTDVTVVEPVFYDPARERVRARPGLRGVAAALAAPVADPPLVAEPAATVRLAMLAPSTRLCVRAGVAAAGLIGMQLGVLLPTVPLRSVVARDRAALWLGPDEWLVLAAEPAAELLARVVCPHPHSLVDVSGQTVAMELAGPNAALCLNAFCALDLDLVAFPVGMCTRTLLGAAEVVLWRIAAEMFRVEVPRSFLGYVWGCLEEARLEFRDPADV